MHEILTLQLGHRANYLATHFWNTQESYFTYDNQDPSPIDHDKHFRPGIGTRGEDTFTPRTLIYDLKGGFGGLKKWGGGYEGVDVGEEEAREAMVWNGNVVVQKETSIHQSEYLRGLDEGFPIPPKLTTETVRFWSDFSRVFYHPRSIVQINDYELGSSLMPFEKWESGAELFAGIDKEHDLLDRDVRVWAEECDQMQGIQVFTGGDDAWGGFGAKYVERLRDEFGKMAIWVWGMEDERKKGHKAARLLRTVNGAKTIHEISTQASMYIPLSIPPALPKYVSLDRSSHWHTSALLSIALETMTLPSRLRYTGSNHVTFDDIGAALNVNGNQRIANLQCSIVDPSVLKRENSRSGKGSHDRRVPGTKSGELLPDEQDSYVATAKLDMDLFGGGHINSITSLSHRETANTFGQVESLRGDFMVNEGDGDDEAGLARKRRRLANLPLLEKYHSLLEFPILDSFPEIFFQSHPSTMAVTAALSTTSRVSRRIKDLQKVTSRAVNLDEREALSNGLGEIGEAYEEGWQSGSDNESDEWE